MITIEQLKSMSKKEILELVNLIESENEKMVDEIILLNYHLNQCVEYINSARSIVNALGESMNDVVPDFMSTNTRH